MDAAVDARAHRGLGHNEQFRLSQELADFRRDGHELVAAAQQPHLVRPQQSEPGLELRFERVLAVAIGIVAGAEQGKIVCGDPLQELDRFGDFFGRQRRRVV